MSLSFHQWFFKVHFCFPFLVPPGISLGNMLACSADHSESLSVLAHLLCSWVFVRGTPLALTPEELFQGILGNLFTEEEFDSRNAEDLLHQCNE